jgi:two-component system cell cycle sensor histidine kinase/response regulator CckA
MAIPMHKNRRLQGSTILTDYGMDEKPTYEELEQRVKDLEEKLHRQLQKDACIAENALHESEKRYKRFIDNAPLAMFAINTNGEFICGNKKLFKMIGYPRSEILGRSAAMLYETEADFKWVEEEKCEQIRRFGAGTVETRWRRKDGTIIDVLLNSAPIDIHDESVGVTFTALDITGQKKMIEQLQEDRDREQMFLDIAEVMFLALDKDGKVNLINKKGCEILGYPETQILGKSWFDHFMPDRHKEKAKNIFQQLMNEEAESIEYFESPILAKDGERRYIDWHNTLLKDKTGAVVGTFSSGEDITERKKAKKKSLELQIQLQHAQKMKAIGTLAGGIAHDFNNILMPLLIHTEMVLESLPEDSPWIFNLEEVLMSGKRARDLVKQILTFSRQNEEQKAHLKLRFIIEDCLKLIRSSLPSTIEIRLNIENQSGTDTIYADLAQMQQVLMNLCTNAYHAMRDKGGVLEIGLAAVNVDSNRHAVLSELSPGTYHRLSIRDTGHGMEKKVMERIFDPYFTTKEKGEGTGLGLSVVHGIVKNHGGAITVDSKPGEGAAFHVFLPVEERKENIELAKCVEMPTGNERVLFVDDEPATANVVKTVLERLGYTVETRTNSLEALEVFRSDPYGLDLVITDMTMPQMTGKELARQIMNIRQDVPVILCSGFSEQMDEEKAAKLGIRAFVMKPVVRSELAQIIRKVLDPAELRPMIVDC